MVTYVVRLDPEEREQLLAFVHTGRAAAAMLLHARILRTADVGEGSRRWTDAEIAEALDSSAAIVHRVRQTFVEWGMETALSRQRLTGRQYRTMDGAQEAQLIAVACRPPPEGRARWTLTLLADKLVVHWTSWRRSVLCVSAPREKKRAQTVAAEAMGDPPAGERRVCLCHGGRAGGLHAPRRPPAPAGMRGRGQHAPGDGNPRAHPGGPGQPERGDYEYERKGTANLCMVFEPLAGQRRVKVTERRTAVDFAHLLRELVDVQYPQAEQMVLVMDNRNTHTPASLYEAFAPAEARRLMERLEA